MYYRSEQTASDPTIKCYTEEHGMIEEALKAEAQDDM